MTLQETLETLLQTKISRYAAPMSVACAIPILLLHDYLRALIGSTEQMAAMIVLTTSVSILFLGSLVCLVSVVKHCRQQEEEIKSLASKLKSAQTVRMAEDLQRIHDAHLAQSAFTAFSDS